jgi:hypothetical protein
MVSQVNTLASTPRIQRPDMKVESIIISLLATGCGGDDKEVPDAPVEDGWTLRTKDIHGRMEIEGVDPDDSSTKEAFLADPEVCELLCNV